ncbi:MAG TPA: hypothetical protein DIT13_14490 [Verrucomicrobiales bacterium]|nr:hypothetical protein [Verrucomicrobiales bacterium]HRJ07268.1 hypothetical protein [Prosthecobacter sp.]HRK13258.1 hypothetical protein [Prosthecobacter sp.]
MKHGIKFAVRAFVLMLATVLVLISTWAAYTFIADGLSAQMMGFEREPAQGWAYWRWFYLKRSMWGILGTAGILLVFGALVAWGWVAFVRDVRRK